LKEERRGGRGEAAPSSHFFGMFMAIPTLLS
jgi:hypothetical protein